jgi:uncharacterized protein YfaS (alpha-2-macroglobulin family)
MAQSDNGAPDSTPEESSDNQSKQKSKSGGKKRKRNWWEWFPPYRPAAHWRTFWRRYLKVWAVLAVIGIAISFPAVRSPGYFLVAWFGNDAPTLRIYDYCPVYTTSEKPVFIANVSGASELAYRLYPKSALVVGADQETINHVDCRPDLPILNEELENHHIDQRIKGYPIVEKTSLVNPLDVDRSGLEISLPALPPGDYFLQTKVTARLGKSVESIDFFRVTNLGLIVKSDPDKVVFQSIDLITRKPRKDVAIDLFTRAVKTAQIFALSELGTAHTDANGLATIKRKPDVSYEDWSGLVVDAVQGKERAYCGPYFSQRPDYADDGPHHSFMHTSSDALIAWNTDVQQREHQDQRIFLMTDRPVYRLGQRVFYSGVLMVYDTNGIANRGKGQAVHVRVDDPSSQQLADRQTTTDASGSFSGYFDIPPKTETGNCTIEVSLPDGAEDTFNVAVMQYRRPEYQVIIKPSAPHLVQGTHAKATIKAEYYFGAPVTNASIKYEISPYPDGDKRSQFAESIGLPDNSYRSPYFDWQVTFPQTVTGTAITDRNGNAEIEIPTAMPTPIGTGPGSYGFSDIDYSIKAQATDSSRMTVQATGDYLVTRGAFAVVVNPSTKIAAPGDKVTARVKVFSYDKAPLPSKRVSVKLSHWEPKDLSPWQQINLWIAAFRSGQPFVTQMTEVPVVKQDVTTKADGTAELTLSTPADLAFNNYYLTAECEDDAHNVVGDVAELWIGGQDFVASALDQKDEASVQLDRASYAPFTVAKALLHLPIKSGEQATALLTIEGRKLYDVKVLKFTGPSKVVEIPIDPQWVPNAFVCLTFVDKQHSPQSCTKEIGVSAQLHQLKLKLTSDSLSYKPGGTVHYQIEARDSKNRLAKNTAVVLSVEDQSMDDIVSNVSDTDETFGGGISGNPASEIERAIFGKPCSNWVVTDYSFGDAYTGKLSKPPVFDGGGMGLVLLPAIAPAAPLGIPVFLTMMVSRVSEQEYASKAQIVQMEAKMSSGSLRMEGVPAGANFGKSSDAGSAPQLQGATNGTIGPQGVEANRGTSRPQQFSHPPSKRRTFKELAAWMPTLVTDANGIARADVKLPDDLTTWKATAYGVVDTNVGSTEYMVTSSLPLIARLALPRFFREGDTGYITSVLNNTSNVTQSVKLTLKVPDEFSITDPLTKIVAVGPKSSTRYSWPVHVLQAGDAKISLTAQGTDYGDALERNLPVHPFGYTAFFMRSGVLTDATAKKQFPIVLPDNAKLATGKFHLSLSSSSIGPVLGNFEKLIDYPYGCTEQTMSRLEPSIVALNLKKYGAPLSQNDTKKFRDVYDIAMVKLQDYLHPDGGWGWWKTDDSSPYLSSLVMEGFFRLKEVGYPVDQSIVDRGLGYLKTQSDQLLLKSWSRDDAITHAKIIYVLSLYNERPSTSSILWHMANVDSMSPEELSYMTLAFKNVGDNKNMKVAVDRLLALRNDTDDFTDWDHTDALYAKLRMKDRWSYTYRFTGVESTALALRAVSAADPGNDEVIERTSRWILAQRDENGWENTKTTAEVFQALLEKEIALSRGVKPDFKASVSIGQKLLNSFAFTKLVERGERTVDLGLMDKPKGVALAKDGPGRLYYSSLLQYERPLKNGEELFAKSSPTDLHIKRSLFQLKQIGVSHEHKPLYQMVPLKGQSLKEGELILMRVDIHTPLPIPYVLIEAPLPSGAEAADDVLIKVKHQDDHGKEFDAEESTAAQGSHSSHTDVLDDRMAFFYTNVETGDMTLSKVLRMEMPGKFNVNPVTLQAMYTTGIRGYSSADSVSVGE